MAITFRWNLKEMRELKGKERTDIVYETRIPYGTIAKLETNPYSKRIDASIVHHLALSLNCEMQELVQIVDDGLPEQEPEKPKRKKG